jgi:hypothetical protein
MWNVLDRPAEFARRSSSARSPFSIPEEEVGVGINLDLR